MVRRRLAALGLVGLLGATAGGPAPSAALPGSPRPQRPGVAERGPDRALVAELDALARALRERLMAAEPLTRAGLLQELDPLTALLRGELALAREPAEERPVRLALYRALSARAEFDRSLALEGRLALFDEAIALAAASGEAEAWARALVLKGELLVEQGRLGAARAPLEQAAHELPAAPRTRAFALFALAEVEARLGGYERALAALDEAERACLPGQPWDALRGRIAGTRGQVFLDLGRLDRASECFAAEARAFEPLRAEAGDADRHWKDLAALELHALHLALAERRWRGAAERAARAPGALPALPEPWRAVFESVRAEALSRLADEDPALLDEARAAFRGALAGALPERERMVCELRFARLQARAGELGEAALLLDQARERLARLRSAGGAAEVAPEQVLLATEEARLALAEGERAGADGERRTLGARQATLEAAFRQRLELWRDAPLLPGGLGFLQQPARRSWLWALARLALALDPEGGPERALSLVLQAQAQGVLVRGLGLAVGTPAELRERLCAPGRGLLVLLPSPDGTLAFAVSRAAVEHFELAPEAELLALVREGTLDELARALLPPPLAARLEGWSELVLVGYELFGRLPFEELATPTGRRLGADWALSFLPSASLGLALAAREAPRSPAAWPTRVWLGPPEPAPEVRERWPELAPLSLPAAERARLERVLGPGGEILAGGRASPSELASALGRAAVVQVLAHGVLGEERERGALLVLSPDAPPAGPSPRDPDALAAARDGLVGAAQVARWPACELVVLTVCGGGAGPLRRGDAAMGNLGGAFLAAGARCVVLGEEELSLASTLAFSLRFHVALGAGLSPAAALARARRDLAAERGWEALGGLRALRALGWAHAPLAPGAGPPVPTALLGDPGGSGPRSRGSDALLLAAGLCAAGSLAAGARALVLRRRA